MTNIEKQIAHEIVKANGLGVTKLGLRFDKVVVRLFSNLSDFFDQYIPEGITVLITVTAPIKLPSKTEYELKERIKYFLKSGNRALDHRATILQNAVRIRIVESSANQTTKFIGFVHNPGSDSKLLLDLASRWFLKN